MKNPGGHITPSDIASLGDSDTKKFIIHQEMVMLENKGQGSNARIIFQGVIRIPKLYQRNGAEDRTAVLLLCNQLDTVSCIQCIYKEFR